MFFMYQTLIFSFSMNKVERERLGVGHGKSQRNLVAGEA